MVRARRVLPTPGTSSRRTCPSVSSATRTSSIASAWPTTTLPASALSRSAAAATSTAIRLPRRKVRLGVAGVAAGVVQDGGGLVVGDLTQHLAGDADDQ